MNGDEIFMAAKIEALKIRAEGIRASIAGMEAHNATDPQNPYGEESFFNGERELTEIADKIDAIIEQRDAARRGYFEAWADIPQHRRGHSDRYEQHPDQEHETDLRQPSPKRDVPMKSATCVSEIIKEYNPRPSESSESSICECQKWAIKYAFSPDRVHIEEVTGGHHPRCLKNNERV